MKKIEFEIKLLIKFYDSFFFGGGNGSGEIQSYLLRDINGFPYISGSALKGCMSKYAAALSYLVPEFNHHGELFGTGGVKQGSLYFENGNLTSESASVYSGMQEEITEIRTGVSINDYTGAKKEGFLYAMELSGMGGNMVFDRVSGCIGQTDLCIRRTAYCRAWMAAVTNRVPGFENRPGT